MKDDKDWKIGLLIVIGFGLSLVYTTVIFQTLKDEIYKKDYILSPDSCIIFENDYGTIRLEE